MAPLPPATTRFSWFHDVSKGVALTTSSAAAIISIVGALYTYGVIGHSASHKTIGNIGAAWVRLKPVADSANAIGDTVHFAATVADKNGSILVGASPVWTTGDSTIATVSADGSVIARGPGTTSVKAVVGDIVASASVVVKQLVAGVAIVNPAGDTTVSILEGNQLQLHAHALDARGHVVPGRLAMWHIDDTTIATIGPTGILFGTKGGHGLVSANVEGASAYLPVTVVTPAADLAVVGGTGQRALAGHQLPQRIVVRAVTRKGAPATGKVVTFRLRGAQGKLDPQSAITDGDGRARTQWTLGDDPGIQTLLATVENVDSAASIDAEAEPVAANTRATPIVAALHARAGATLTDSVGVRITDSTGRVLAGVPVRWTAIDGTVQPASPRTDSAGVARAQWTLSSHTGSQRLRVFVGPTDSRIAPSTISAIAAAGSPAKIIVVSGDRQHGTAGAALPKSIVLRVVDVAGNSAAQVPVTLAVSGGTVDDVGMTTDADGVVRIHWTMGHTSGDYGLTVTTEGVSKPAKVIAHAASSTAANLSFDDAPAAKDARPNARRIIATVTDIYGNPVADAAVSFLAKDGAVSPTRAVTDDRGRVSLSWMTGGSAGEQTLRGIVRGTDVAGAFVAQIVQAGAAKPTAKVKKPNR
jgi:hypothetical protein